MTKRRLLYWGLPIIGAIIGTVITIILRCRGEDEEAFDNQLDALIGAAISVGITTTLLLLVRTN